MKEKSIAPFRLGNAGAIMDDKRVEWNGGKQQKAIDVLARTGHMIVSPTKVGYIIMTSDVGGLKRKFSAKQRALNKSACRPTRAGCHSQGPGPRPDHVDPVRPVPELELSPRGLLLIRPT